MSRVRLGAIALLVVGTLGITGAVSAHAAEPTARLSLFKAIENLDTGASLGDRSLWTMHAVNVATGEEFTGDGLNGVQSRLVPPGMYRVFETGGAPGYAFFSWNCDGEVTTQPERIITIVENQSLTCTVQNNAIRSSLTLVKNVAGGSADPSEWTLRAQGPTNIEGLGGSAEVQNQPARIGVYTLSESGGPAGYAPGPWTCERRDLVTGAVTPVSVAADQVEIDLGAAVTCQITNTGDLPHLTLVKRVVDPSSTGNPLAAAADFTLSASGLVTISGASGSASVDHASVEPGGYALSESGPTGYAGGVWDCVDATSDGAFDGGLLFVRDDSDITCTITNTFTGGWLTLVKDVVGSDQPPSAWTLTATGPVNVSGAAGGTSVTTVPVPAGDYALSEADGPSGYAASPWSCVGGALAADTVAVVAGSNVTCTVTNTLEVGQLTLVKSVINTGGGPLEPEDWILTADSVDTSLSGVSGSSSVSFATVTPGTFTLGESSASADAAGYVNEGWVCVDEDDVIVNAEETVEVGPEQSVICTVTNSWTQSTLTLRKQVASAFGAPALPSAWTLGASDGITTFAGPGNSSAVTRVSVAPGDWELSETGGPPGYDELGWTCSGAPVSNGVVSIPAATDVVCVATNAGITPSLTLVKQVDNGARGRAEAADFELKARGPGNAALSGPSGSEFVTDMLLPPGEYVFSEDGPTGYEGSWSCVGTTWDGTTATLAFGENAICTATNVFVGGTLTLRKEIVGSAPDGSTGPADIGDFILSAVGEGPFPRPRIDGASGDDSVTLAPFGEGEYVLSETAAASIPAADYRSGGWTCTGGAVAGDTVEVLAGVDEVCTITNVYDPATGPTVDPDPGTGTTPDTGPALAGTGLDQPVVPVVLLGGVLTLLGVGMLGLSLMRSRRTRGPTGA